MLARNFLTPRSWIVTKILRCQSTSAAQSQDLITVEVDKKSGISKVSMNQKPANNLTLGLLKEFCDKMDYLEKQKVKGMILTSSVGNVFSSGLDFNELVKPDEARINAYWLWFQEAWMKLYGCSFPTAALINGHATDGGSVFAISCDYRVMLPNLTISFNDFPAGIVPPDFVLECTRNVLSRRQSEHPVTSGILYTSQEAFAMELIDEFANNEQEGMVWCDNLLKNYVKISFSARNLTKQSYRKAALAMLKDPKNRSADAKKFIDNILKASTQRDIESYVEKLKAAE